MFVLPHKKSQRTERKGYFMTAKTALLKVNSVYHCSGSNDRH